MKRLTRSFAEALKADKHSEAYIAHILGITVPEAKALLSEGK